MFSVRILTTSAALLLVTGLAQTPAHACDNLFFRCPPPTSPAYPRMGPAPVAPQPQVRWGWETVPAQPVVTAPARTAVAKPSKRRMAKYRARQRTTTKAVAAISKPAATDTKPATTVAAKPAATVEAQPEAVVATKPAAPVAKPAAEPTVAAARSVIFAAASLDDVVRSVKREPDKEAPKEPAAKLVAVVDPGEVNEIDLAAGPVRAVVPAAAAVVEESKSRVSSPAANASVGQVLAIVLCAVAAACAFRFVTKNA